MGEYVYEFNHLARYAPEDVATDVAKQYRFRSGLSEELKEKLSITDFPTGHTQDVIDGFAVTCIDMAMPMMIVEALRSCLWQLCYRLDAGLPAPSEALATAWQAWNRV